MRKLFGIIAVGVGVIVAVTTSAYAKLPASIRDAMQSAYAPADKHRGLITAAEPLEWPKVHTFVVLERSGIPVDKAFWFGTNQEYEYRGVGVDLATSQLTTRRGRIYTYVDRGLLMVVAGVQCTGNTVYLRLLSAERYHPKERTEKRPSRVGVALAFKISPELRSGDAAPVLAALEQWAKPFADRASAERYAAAVMGEKKRLMKP